MQDGKKNEQDIVKGPEDVGLRVPELPKGADEIIKPAEAGIESDIAIEVGKQFAHWSATRIQEYLSKRKEKKMLAGAFAYFDDTYATKRGYCFREGLIPLIENHVNSRKYAFGFLFGDIVKDKKTRFHFLEGQEKPVPHTEYEASAFIPVQVVQELVERARDRLEADEDKKRMSHVIRSCKRIEKFMRKLPVDKKGHLDGEKVGHIVHSISDVLWYLFFEIDYEEVLYLYKKFDDYAAPSENSETLKTMEGLLYSISEVEKILQGIKRKDKRFKKYEKYEKDYIKYKEQFEHFQRRAFFTKFLGFFSLSPILYGSAEAAAVLTMRHALATYLTGDLRAGATFISPGDPDTRHLKLEFVRMFHIITVTLEKLFEQFTELVKKKNKWRPHSHIFNLMKIWPGRHVTISEKYNPIFVVFSPRKRKKIKGIKTVPVKEKIQDRCVCYVDHLEGEKEEFQIVRIPYNGQLLPDPMKAANEYMRKKALLAQQRGGKGNICAPSVKTK